MRRKSKTEILQRAAQRAAGHRFFVAGALQTYCSIHQMDEEELAKFLGCSPDRLSKLALCRRPDTESSQFRAEVERIASYVGADAIRLAQLFREVASIEALRSAPRESNVATEDGWLMAARDRAEEIADEPQQSSAEPDNPPKQVEK